MSGGAAWEGACSRAGAGMFAPPTQYAAANYYAGMERAAAVCRRSHTNAGQDEQLLWQARFCAFLDRLPALQPGAPPITMHTATPAEVLAYCTMEVVPNHGKTPLNG